MLDDFISYCPQDNARLQQIVGKIGSFRETSEHLVPTSWHKTPLEVAGLTRMDLKCRKTMKQVKTLCKKMLIKPPSGFIREHCFHYGRYDAQTLVSFLSISVVNLNRTPGSIAVSVDVAVSTCTNHTMSKAIGSIKRTLSKRRNACVLFAQVARTESAQTFWSGQLTHTKRASIMTALVSQFEPRYPIYADTDDMGIFY